MTTIANNITNSPPRPAVTPAAVASTRENTSRQTEKTETPPGDKVTLGEQATTDAGTYPNPRTNPAQTRTDPMQARTDIATMLEESNRKVQEIINLILPLMTQQGLDIAKVVSGEQKLTADAASIEKAKAAIAEDGEMGVRQVAERILNFSKASIGDDPAKLAAVRAAVEKGFKQATEMLGGKLPEISQQTYAAVMAQFDQWESAGIPSGNVSLAPKTATVDSKAA